MRNPLNGRFIMAALCVCVYGSTALGQVMSEEAELERLQNKAKKQSQMKMPRPRP